MSERRNFPADSKNRTTEGKAVGRDSVDSFAYIFDYISLKIDDNLRVIKLRRLRGISDVPRRIFYENAKLPVRVVEVTEGNIGVVHTPLLHRVFGLGQAYRPEHVIRVRLSGLMFPTSGDNLRITCNSTDASDTARPPPPPSPLPEKKLVKGGSVDNTPAPTEYRSAPSNTVTEAEIVPQPTPYNGCKDKIPDIEPGVYAHSPLCLSWMTDNLLNRKAMISLLDRQEISPAFLYQRKLLSPRRIFVNHQVIKLGLAEAAPVASPHLIKSDIRKLTSLLLQAEQDAEKARVGIWETTRRRTVRDRLRSIWRRH